MTTRNIRLLDDVCFKLIKHAMDIAVKAHADVNHFYDGKPYCIHLQAVYSFGLKWAYLLKGSELVKAQVLSALWVHDLPEDARWSYNDVLLEFGEAVADLAFAVTNNTGKTRKEKADSAYYKKIRNTENADFVKLCDRLGNVWYGLQFGGSMYRKYQSEQQEFKKQLYNPNLQPMWDELDEMLKY